jgi:hypothetical protein
LRVKLASITYFPPYGVLGSAGRGGKGWLKGGELLGEDVASGTEEVKAV